MIDNYKIMRKCEASGAIKQQHHDFGPGKKDRPNAVLQSMLIDIFGMMLLSAKQPSWSQYTYVACR
jgi:hypothetical protein